MLIDLNFLTERSEWRITFSNTLDTDDNNAMGRQFSGFIRYFPGFGIAMITLLFHCSGKYPIRKQLFIMSVSMSMPL